MIPSHQSLLDRCERHHRNAQVQHLSCRVVVLLWYENTSFAVAGGGSVTGSSAHICQGWYSGSRPNTPLERTTKDLQLVVVYGAILRGEAASSPEPYLYRAFSMETAQKFQPRVA